MFPAAGAANTASETTRLSVVYIPLDNRPFHDERVQAMAKSLNIELIMPEEDLYATRLDGQALNANGTQHGNRAALLEWLQEQAQIYDIFILSLDQLLSGGLMNSRCMSENQDLILDDGSAMTEYAVIDYLCELSQTKQLYLIDSVMRLASSCDYGGFQLEHYSIFRAYGNVARPVLKDDALTIENIIANYKYYEDGTTPAYHRAGLSRDQVKTLLLPLSSDTGDMDRGAAEAYLRREAPELSESVSGQTLEREISDLKESGSSVLSLYLDIRERKLRLSDYAMNALCGNDNVHYLLGIDDSAGGNNIQTNELALLSSHLGSNDILYSSLDGLAQAALAKLFCCQAGTDMPEISVTYVGDMADEVQSFNCNTPREMLTQAVDYFGGTIVTEDPDLNVVVLTDTTGSDQKIRDIYRLVNHLNENEAEQIPTIFIDLSSDTDTVRNQMLLENCHLGMLLSYSGRYETPNSVIMAISQGLSRYQSLTIPGFQTANTQQGHLENLTAALVKKLVYSDSVFSSMYQVLENYGLNPSNFITENEAVNQQLTTQMQTTAQPLLDNLCTGNFISTLSPYTLSSITDAGIQACTFPWLRQMEIDFVLSLSYSDKISEPGTFHSAYVEGISDTEFWPEAALSREQATKLIISAAGVSVSEPGSGTFEDISPWAISYVAEAQQHGYINGYPDGTFRGTSPITRAEFVTILSNYIQKEHITLPSDTTAAFRDVPRAPASDRPWYAESVYLLADADIIHGYPDGLLAPTGTSHGEKLWYCSTACSSGTRNHLRGYFCFRGLRMSQRISGSIPIFRRPASPTLQHSLRRACCKLDHLQYIPGW